MKYLADYVWIGGNQELRSKVRVMEGESTLDECNYSDWNYDGSSTGQAIGSDSEVIIKPRKVYKCPFRKGDNVIVLCDTYLPDGTPHKTNRRVNAKEIFDKGLEMHPWFGLEQEYFLMDVKTGKPLGHYNEPIEQGQFYCSAGGRNAFGRKVVDEHLDACLYADLKISGVNAEVAPGQWEFQIGPAEGIRAGDDMWMARYLLERITEKYGVYVDWEPKPIEGDVNGSGCHCNFSTKDMRERDDGLKLIEDALQKLSERHSEHMENYGNGNEKRMTGLHETASYESFSFGRANRGSSVRIGNQTINDGKGYFEDRRPASNCDPYLVTSMIFETTSL